MIDYSNNLRRRFADEIHEKMKTNKDIWVVVGDLGYKVWDDVKRDFPDRFINVGAAEQLLLGVGIGLALEGKIPVVFSITPFLLYRPFEMIRNYVNYESIPVKLIGSGRNKDYEHDGISHWAEEDKDVMKIFGNIQPFWPETVSEIPDIVERMISENVPYYVNLKR